jgi:hypothetical protein
MTRRPSASVMRVAGPMLAATVSSSPTAVKMPLVLATPRSAGSPRVASVDPGVTNHEISKPNRAGVDPGVGDGPGVFHRYFALISNGIAPTA